MDSASTKAPALREEPSAGFWLAASALVAVALIAAARLKGGYVDEYWTMSFADSSVPLERAFRAWSMDSGHPVGFYALSRLGDVILPANLLIRRLSNLVFFGFALLCAWRTGNGNRAFALAFVAAVAASPYVVERFAEYRATFLALMLISALVLRLKLVIEAGAPRRSDAIAIVLLMGALGFIEYPVAIAGLALCGALGLISLVRGRTRTMLLATAGIGSCFTAAGLSVANSARFTIIPSPYFESFGDLIRDLTIVGGTAVLPCVALGTIALVQNRKARIPFRTMLGADRFTLLLVLSIVLTLVGFLIINTATNSLIRRQIFGIIPLVIALLMNASWPYVRFRPGSVALMVLNLIVVSAATALWLKSKPSFDRFGDQLVRAQRACPSLPIYAVLPERISGNRVNPFPMPHQVGLGLSDVAQRHGFRIRQDLPATWLDRKCGAIIWSEYLWMSGQPTRRLVARKLNLPEQSVTDATIQYDDQSLVMQVPPR